MTQSKSHVKPLSLYRSIATIAMIVLAQAVLAIVIVLVTSERTVDDFQRVFMTVGGACAAFGILAMGSSRWSGEMGAERMAMSRRRPRPVGDLPLRRSMFLLIVSSALVAFIGYGLPSVFSR